ncbi:MAG: hypothetical protein MUF87_07810 [Anaerolineae bacterium]|jgi:hypothetical protein|nr:hypothetical protein [Anaerolineae bacterium]
MNTFKNVWIPSPRPRNLWLILLILGAFIGYLLPWIVQSSSSLTFGAYDLAEWITLRLPDRPMQVVLLLRLPPVCIALIIALALARPRFQARWWVALGTVILIAFALLPPLEFINQRGDVNYGQQFQLAIIALIGGVIGLSGLLHAWRAYLIAILGLISAGVSMIGYLQAVEIVQGLGLNPQLGFGMIVFVGASLLLSLYGIRTHRGS